MTFLLALRHGLREGKDVLGVLGLKSIEEGARYWIGSAPGAAFRTNTGSGVVTAWDADAMTAAEIDVLKPSLYLSQTVQRRGWGGLNLQAVRVEGT